MRQGKWIVRSDKILGGTPVFAGTRVPVQTLIDYLQAGHSIGEFMGDFPTVDREHAIGVLESLKHMLLSQPKYDRVASSDINRVRRIRGPKVTSKRNNRFSQHPRKIQKAAYVYDESKYQSVLVQLRNLGWNPEQIPGRQRTVYRLNSSGTVLGIMRNAMKQKRGKWDLYFFGLSKESFEDSVDPNSWSWSSNSNNLADRTIMLFQRSPQELGKAGQLKTFRI